MPRVACLMMQKDEDLLLEPWLRYHGHLFGYENLYVFDNGSASAIVRDAIDRFRELGVRFELRRSAASDFENKHNIFIATINELKAWGGYDLFLPMDCDEFIVHFDADGLTCDRAAILAYLDTLRAEEDVMQIGTLLYNIPGRPDAYYAEDLTKVFFARGRVRDLTHGLHFGATDLSKRYRRVDVTYAHFHNKPFPRLLASARDKLRRRVDVNSPEAVRGFRGHGDHLTRYFAMTEADYVRSFDGRDYVEFPALRQTLRRLGAGDAVGLACATGERPAELGRRLPRTFDTDAYLERYQDVQAAGVPALLHYYRHGVREGRQIA